MTKIIVQALEITEQRGIINKGWGGLGNCKSWHYLFFLWPFTWNPLAGTYYFYITCSHQWKNQRILCTYWTIALMIGYSLVALLW